MKGAGVRKTAALLVMGFLGAALVAPALPAWAGYSGSFQCDLTYDVWPGAGWLSNSTACSGVTVGVATNPSGPCATCTYQMTVDHYNEPCVSAAPVPAVGQFGGRITISSGQWADYEALRAGQAILFTAIAPTTVTGTAVWVPHPPLPNCAAPGPLTVSITGQVFWP